MNPFTVEWTQQALEGLAEAWLQASDRQAVTRAEREIDRRLARDPLGEGSFVHEDLYRLDEPPLVVHYTVDVDARKVEVVLVQ